MKISVFGTGYVGLVAGTCLADLGNEVTCVDVDKKKISDLKKGIIPIFEPGLKELVKKNHSEKRLFFTIDAKEAVETSEVIFIAVGTPQDKDGRADLKFIFQVAETIGKNANSPKIVVDKSTVPVGTAKKIKEKIMEFSKFEIDVVSNPEFLKEGSALKDFLEPDRVIIGAENKNAVKVIESLYSPLNCEILVTTPESAEMIKYASNAFLAAKISFINEIANLCEKVGADIEEVSKGMGADKRIGKYFLNAGCGYGGSCFPKDVKALQRIAEDAGTELKIVKAVEEVNFSQKTVPVKKLKNEFDSLEGKKIVVLGLAFKPMTDDLREASSIEIIKELVREKARVVAIDSVAKENAKKIIKGIEYSDSIYDAVKNADAIILVTEWNEFLEIDFEKIGALMNSKILVDGRNAYNKEKLKSLGFKYLGIGR